jgi:hypothetical protein
MANVSSRKQSYLHGGVENSSSASAVSEGVASPGIAGKLLNDGSVLYNWKQTGSYIEVNYNGIAASELNVEEARIWPDGYGYILTQKQSHQDDIIVLPDGRALNYTLYGYIEIL